jgi:2-methylcitrate dehydratase PrpD
MGEAASATQILGRFVAESRFEALPEVLRHEGRRSILNHIGCALGVARDPAVITALEIMRAWRDGSGFRQCHRFKLARL